MRTPLAWLNLAHNKTRTALATAGVAFAVVLVFMQLGFLGSAENSATLVYNALDFDVLIRSPRYLHVGAARTFPRDRLYQAASVPGVETVSPIYVAQNYWRHPREDKNRAILMMGMKTGSPTFRNREMQEKAGLLTLPRRVLIDRCSRRDFGPRNGRQFSDADVGMETEVGEKRVWVVEHFSMGTGFAADGALLLSDEGFCRINPQQPIDRVSLGLVKLRPGISSKDAVAALKKRLGDDVDVLTRPEVEGLEINHWVNGTSIGIIFQMGVAVALLVGTMIVYQVLAGDVASHLAEYSTLKAIGYGDGFLAGVVLQQALILAVLGFVPGLAAAWGLYWVTGKVAHLPIEMTAGRVVFVLTLAVAMCVVSGLGALRKVRTADPADLF